MGMTCEKSDTYAESASDAATLPCDSPLSAKHRPDDDARKIHSPERDGVGNPGTSPAITMERPDAPPSAKLFGAVNST